MDEVNELHHGDYTGNASHDDPGGPWPSSNSQRIHGHSSTCQDGTPS